MRKTFIFLGLIYSFTFSHFVMANEDTRQLVEFPSMMQNHMMANMRDHLETINEILHDLANDELDHAAEIAENRLGMTSLKSHSAGHMAKFMPKGMQHAGTSMHKAASRFALTAQEGDVLKTYQALGNITATCVTCHTGYKIR